MGILVLTGILCSLAAAGPARASGCHVPDRPVLGTRLAWEQESVGDPDSRATIIAPPVLTHLPCPGEVPHNLNSTTVPSGLACLAPVGLDLPAFSEALRAGTVLAHLQVMAARLDRPPRLDEPCVTIQRWT
jgi:hypothetical protein